MGNSVLKVGVVMGYLLLSIFSFVILLPVLDRILRGNVGDDFPRLRVVVSRLSLFVGWLLILTFLYSMVFVLRTGFPED